MKVAVIGAGPSGLVFLKELREVGVDAELFEAGDAIGGVFSRPYAGARLTSSNLITSFSDLPPEDPRPTIWDFEQYLAYLRRYVEHFGLAPYIHLRTPVARLAPSASGFTLEFGGAGAQRSPLHVDRVAVCTGTHAQPVMPCWPGMEEFAGQIVHAGAFESGAPFTGKRVLVVGGGESASDIALEVARVARASAISVRRAFGHLVPRNRSEVSERFPDVGAADVDTSRIHHMLPIRLGPRIAKYRAWQTLRFARSEDLPVLEYIALSWLDQGTSAQTHFGTKNASVARAIVEHGCRRKPGVARLRANAVEFVDGTVFEADAIICATGYRPAFPYFAEALAPIAADAVRPRATLYRHCFHPDLRDRMAFGGYARPAFGAIPPIAEMQARWFALLCRGERALPPSDRMRTAIYRDDLEARKQFVDDAGRLANLTDFLRLLDQIADEIGCRPEGLRLRDPQLWWKVLTGPITGGQYRLVGPGAKPDVVAPLLRRAPHDPGLLPHYLTLVLGGTVLGRVPGLGHLRPDKRWI